MPVNYVETAEAIAARGLRMTVVSEVPSPWGEAAKGILHFKGIEWRAVRLTPADEEQVGWTGSQSAPVVMYNDEPPRHGWVDILMLAEKLAPEPSLLPLSTRDRALAIGLSHELMGIGGLADQRRLQMMHMGYTGRGGFLTFAADYLAEKYGYSAEEGEASFQRVSELLQMFANQLRVQEEAGSDYFVGSEPTCVDFYCAAVMAMFKPLPEEVCAMRERTRVAFESVDAATNAALDPILLKHRDMMYERHMELPLLL